jgi:hypothetical protein
MDKILILVLLVTVAYSQDSSDSIPTNEYRYRNGALICFTDSISRDLEYACLHIGSINIGDSFNSIENKYDKPNQTINQSGGKEVKVYHLKSTEAEITYLALTVKEKVIIAIQIAGATPKEDFSFSSINIGDSPRLLIETLGKPSSSKYVEETGATLWSYAPFPFSFEIMDKKVYSIKIWQP